MAEKAACRKEQDTIVKIIGGERAGGLRVRHQLSKCKTLNSKPQDYQKEKNEILKTGQFINEINI
jgi:hypothetical protein